MYNVSVWCFIIFVVVSVRVGMVYRKLSSVLWLIWHIKIQNGSSVLNQNI